MEHRNVAVILLYNKKKQILLQHKADDAKRLPGYWAFFGGGLEGQETPEQAVRRETWEELDYNLKQPKLVWTQNFSDQYTEGTKYVFVEAYDPTQKLVLKEGKDMAWKRIEETKYLKIVDHDKEVLEKIKEEF